MGEHNGVSNEQRWHDVRASRGKIENMCASLVLAALWLVFHRTHTHVCLCAPDATMAFVMVLPAYRKCIKHEQKTGTKREYEAHTYTYMGIKRKPPSKTPRNSGPMQTATER